MIKYKGYIGKIEFDDKHDIFHGNVININDVVTFEGKTTKELRKSFKDSIDVYIEFCKEQNKEPEKPYSGRLLFRTSTDNHKLIAETAARKNLSINQWIEKTLLNALRPRQI